MTPRIRAWTAIAAAWLAVGLFFAAQAHTMAPELFHRELSWRSALVVNLNHVAVWAAFTPVVFAVMRRWPFQAQGWPLRAGLHLVAGLLIASAQLLLSTASRHLLGEGGGRSLSELLTFTAHLNFHTNLITYACVAVGAAGWDMLRRARDQELRASKLEAQLATAQLAALRMQLHPHFLFNALNGVSALIQSDPEAADEMLERLGTLLRLSLERGDEPEIALRTELDFIAQYLELERLQYADRLKVVIDVPVELLEARVPALILQPLVENALRHGIGPKAEGGTVRIHARALKTQLELGVGDDGYGPQEALRTGIGLANVRERLRCSYGEAGSLVLERGEGGGALARLGLPLNLTPKGEAGP